MTGLGASWFDAEPARGVSPALPAGTTTGCPFAARLALELSTIACALDTAGAACLGCCRGT